MPRRSLHVVLSSALALGVVCGCGSSQKRTQCQDGRCALPATPAPHMPDVPAPADSAEPPLETWNGYDAGPYGRDITGTPTDVPPPGLTPNPFESAPHGNPFETSTTEDGPDRTPAWDGGDSGRQPLAGPPVEAPTPEIELAPEEMLARLGATIERDDAGRVVLIDLSGSRVQDADLALLTGMTELSQLDLSSTAITDAGLRHLSGLGKLQLLALSGTQVSDAGLAHIESMNLRFLLLGFTPVSDRGVDRLARMRKLEGLSLRGSQLTASGVGRLKRELPNCRIVADTQPVSTPADGSSNSDSSEKSRSNPAPKETPESDTDSPSLRETSIRSELISGMPAGTVLDLGATDLSAAEIELARIATGNLADPATWHALGEYFALTGRRSAAIPWLQAAVQAAPGERLYHYHLALALARSSRPYSALPHMIEAVGGAAAHHNLGVIAFRQGDLSTSRLHFAEALRQNPELAVAQVWATRIDRELSTRTASRGTIAQ